MWIAVVTIASLALAAGAIARFDEAKCIGCTHCLRARPVDAIVGAHQYMPTVITAERTGCELYVAPCPVDGMSMETVR